MSVLHCSVLTLLVVGHDLANPDPLEQMFGHYSTYLAVCRYDSVADCYYITLYSYLSMIVYCTLDSIFQTQILDIGGSRVNPRLTARGLIKSNR